MKALGRYFLMFALIAGTINVGFGQSSRKERQAAKAAAIKKMVDGGDYIFKANYANPQGGGQKILNDDYDLRISKDSIIAFLPFYGTAYLAPIPGETEGGIKFTSTKFVYDSKLRKRGGWEVFIKPKDNNVTDWRDVQQMWLNISENGYATLQVISSNRSSILFDGEIEQKNNM